MFAMHTHVAVRKTKSAHCFLSNEIVSEIYTTTKVNELTQKFIFKARIRSLDDTFPVICSMFDMRLLQLPSILQNEYSSRVRETEYARTMKPNLCFVNRSFTFLYSYGSNTFNYRLPI